MEQLKQRDVGGGEQRPERWKGQNPTGPCGPELRPEDFVFQITEYSLARNGQDQICCNFTGHSGCHVESRSRSRVWLGGYSRSRRAVTRITWCHRDEKTWAGL